MDEAERLENAKHAPRSVSQIQQWERCPYSWYLTRVVGAWQRPAAWFPQGTAVHKAAEEYEKSARLMSLTEAQDVFRESYEKEVNRYAAITPNFDYWSPSGRYGGEQDVERRYGIGLEQVGKYLDYYQGPGNREWVWTAPDGKPGIELSFTIDLDGIKVRGFIDAVINHPVHGVHVRDNKTGNQPGGDLQLGVYATAINDLYETNVTTGDYWMGRTGKPTAVYDLSGWSRDRISDEFHRIEAEIQTERFDPKPSPENCRRCSVATSCPFAAQE